MDDNRKGKRILTMRDDEKKPMLSAKAKKEIREWLVSLAVAIVAVVLIRMFLFTVISVDGPSMEDTLLTHDRLIVTIADVKLGGLNRFDVVVCHFPDSPNFPDFPESSNFPVSSYRNTRYVKRIIGLPGDTIDYDKELGMTLINGEPLEEVFLYENKTSEYHSGKGKWERNSLFKPPYEIPEGYYFVMGDDRDNSNDSRAVGLIAKDQIIGRGRLIIWPLNRIGVITADAPPS